MHRLLRLLNIVYLATTLIACGGGSGSDGRQANAQPINDTCDAASVLVDGHCQAFAERLDERAETPFVENGEPVSLEIVLFKPFGEGRYPTVVINHGSTGNGSDPSLFDDTFTSKPITRLLVEQGWIVAFPQRRGRGRSDGLYDEGFAADRSGYSCQQSVSLAGAARALDDIDAITEWLLLRPEVDTTRMVLAGTSRGGILSIAYLARRPEVYRGAVNFVGGWLGEGCGDYRAVNRSLFVQGADFPGPSLWVYANADSFYGVDYSRSNFDAFTAAGGLGDFRVYTRDPGFNGHFIINSPDLYGPDLLAYLAEL